MNQHLLETMPKFDLHHHLDGAFFIEDLYAEAKRRGLPQGNLPLEEFTQNCRVSPQCKTLTEFLAVFDFFYEIGREPSFQREQARKTVHLFQNLGIIYAETRFSPHIYATANISPEEITEAILAGLQQGFAETGLRVNAILCMMRGAPLVHLEQIIALAEKYRSRGVVGIDLAGDESKYPCSEYAALFQKAAKQGIPVTIHAGEGAGAESVRYAIEKFGARRIGHGIRSREDKSLIEILKEKQIALEICLTSNLQTGTVKSLADHPFQEYLRQGLMVTINTDDPTVSGIDIRHEWLTATNNFNLSSNEIRQLLHNSAQAAFCDSATKDKLLTKIDNWFTENQFL